MNDLDVGFVAMVVAGVLFVWLIIKLMLRHDGQPAEKPLATCICGGCGGSVAPQEVKPGSLVVAVVLLCCFVIPGVFYCMWREAAAKKVCPSCGSLDMVPFGSPRGRQLLEAFGHVGQSREPVPDEIHLRRLLRQHRAKGSGN
jgi:hypothetical protein